MLWIIGWKYFSDIITNNSFLLLNAWRLVKLLINWSFSPICHVFSHLSIISYTDLMPRHYSVNSVFFILFASFNIAVIFITGVLQPIYFQYHSLKLILVSFLHFLDWNRNYEHTESPMIRIKVGERR